MPDEEVKFFRDFFNYRKETYAPLYDNKYWDDLYDKGIELADKYKNTPFEQFALSLIVAHQMDVGRRYNE